MLAPWGPGQEEHTQPVPAVLWQLSSPFHPGSTSGQVGHSATVCMIPWALLLLVVPTIVSQFHQHWLVDPYRSFKTGLSKAASGIAPRQNLAKARSWCLEPEPSACRQNGPRVVEPAPGLESTCRESPSARN